MFPGSTPEHAGVPSGGVRCPVFIVIGNVQVLNNFK